MIKNTNVISAYSICRKITLENSKTFFFASIFLDKAKGTHVMQYMHFVGTLMI